MTTAIENVEKQIADLNKKAGSLMASIKEVHNDIHTIDRHHRLISKADHQPCRDERCEQFISLQTQLKAIEHQLQVLVMKKNGNCCPCCKQPFAQKEQEIIA